jgi:hypothetical protein
VIGIFLIVAEDDLLGLSEAITCTRENKVVSLPDSGDGDSERAGCFAPILGESR